MGTCCSATSCGSSGGGRDCVPAMVKVDNVRYQLMSWGRLRVVLVATEGRRAGQIGVGRGRRRLKMEKLVSIAKSITAKVDPVLKKGPCPACPSPCCAANTRIAVTASACRPLTRCPDRAGRAFQVPWMQQSQRPQCIEETAV